MKMRYASDSAFTLIEMMIVVALIAILIGGVFKLMGTVGENARRARTVERLQKLQNAISGFYSEYGTYPPVQRYCSPDPYVSQDEDTGATTAKPDLTEGENWKNAKRAAGAQYIAFEYPSKTDDDEYILREFKVYAANQNTSAFADDKTEWRDVKLFRYGLLAFLVPRVQVVGGNDLAEGKATGNTPKLELIYKKAQWTEHNESGEDDWVTNLKNQNQRERTACARWMPNLEGIIYGGMELMGVKTAWSREMVYSPESPMNRTYSQGTGNRHALACMTVLDEWWHELFYYSAPPYQSYRIWSAGPNGKTFPPWIPLETLSPKDRTVVIEWISDDIARFDR